MSRSDLHVRELLRLVRFVVVGVTNTAINMAVYASLLALDVSYVAASVAASAVAISIAYFLNRRFTFRVAEHSSSLVIRFFSVQIGAAIANVVLLALLIERAGMDPLLAQVVIVPPIVLTTFALNRLVVFRHHVDTLVS